MKLKTKPPNSKGWGVIIIQDMTLLRQGEKSAQHKAGIKIQSKEGTLGHFSCLQVEKI